MKNYHKELVSALKTIGLPVYYEMALTSNSKTPCISYMELNNYAATETKGATVGYSYITYQVKVWANDIEVMQNYALKVDSVMRPLGFKRISSAELYNNNFAMVQKVLNYEILTQEDF